MIEANVANLFWLNVGKSGGEPLKLPTDFDTVQALLKRNGLDDGQHDLVITEYHTEIPGLAKCLSRYDSLDELNYLAALLSGMDAEAREKFAAAIQDDLYTSETEDLINLAQNLDCYDLYPDVKTEEDLGRLRADGRLNLPDDCRFYFDYGAYGEDTAINEGGVFTDRGYIVNNRSGFTAHYDGRNVPEEYRVYARPAPEQERPVSIMETMKRYQAAIDEGASAPDRSRPTKTHDDR